MVNTNLDIFSSKNNSTCFINPLRVYLSRHMTMNSIERAYLHFSIEERINWNLFISGCYLLN